VRWDAEWRTVSPRIEVRLPGREPGHPAGHDHHVRVQGRRA
jgi:hypothetical protein